MRSITTCGRFPPLFQTEDRQLGMGIDEQNPEPLMDIHPDTAKALDISDDDWAYIGTRRGVIKIKANIKEGFHPKVINCEDDWWFPYQPGQETMAAQSLAIQRQCTYNRRPRLQRPDYRKPANGSSIV